MIKIFSKNRQTLNSDIETYIVKFKTYKSGFSVEYPTVKEVYQAFTNKDVIFAFPKR